MSIDLLEQATNFLEKKNIDYWVAGGYALDIAVGKLTREHANVDLLIRIEDSGKVKELFESKEFNVEFINDKLVAVKDKRVLNIMAFDEFKGHYVITTLNIEVHVPKILMNHEVTGLLEGKSYRRIPNELLYLFLRYSINQSDSLIVKNLPVSKEMIKSIKTIIKRR